MPKHDSTPAFPAVVPEGGAGHFGMSLRDYFAAHAPSPGTAWINQEVGKGRSFDMVLAAHAYEYADAMLEAREK